MVRRHSTASDVTETTIVKTPDVYGGEPRIAGRRVAVRDVWAYYSHHQWTPERIAEELDLTLAQVHAALSYYYAHPEEMQELDRQEDQLVKSFFEEHPSKLQR